MFVAEGGKPWDQAMLRYFSVSVVKSKREFG
jgi:hypothetical protein